MQDIANAAGVGVSTAHRYIAKLKAKNKFKKTSIGKFLNEKDGKKISELLGFDYSKLEKQKTK